MTYQSLGVSDYGPSVPWLICDACDFVYLTPAHLIAWDRLCEMKVGPIQVVVACPRCHELF